MNIILKPKQEAFIQSRLESGRYQTVDEVITVALRLLAAQDEEYQQWLEETGKQIDVGLTDLEQGNVVELDEVIKTIQKS
uniref:Putative transcriptional regulators, CopG/Arc/MetJ family n=1 Tax=Cyanothece sp. (strain PCC 7425 / ATCC 29141) TaxID=395961 RepID=B8HMH0_CYAP4